MAHLLKSRDPHLAGGEKWSFFSWGRWGRPASFNSLQTYVPHPPSLRDDHRGHDRRHRHPHRPCHCHFHSHLQKFFPNSVIGVFSHSKGPGAGRNSQIRTAQGWEPGSQEGVSFSKRIPSKGSQVPRNTKRFPKRFAGKVPRNRFPSKGSQQEVPKQRSQEKVSKQGFPARGSQAKFPGRLSQVRSPRGSQARFPGKGSQARVSSKRFPSRVARKRFPSKVPRKRFPSKG